MAKYNEAANLFLTDHQFRISGAEGGAMSAWIDYVNAADSVGNVNAAKVAEAIHDSGDSFFAKSTIQQTFSHVRGLRKAVEQAREDGSEYSSIMDMVDTLNVERVEDGLKPLLSCKAAYNEWAPKSAKPRKADADPDNGTADGGGEQGETAELSPLDVMLQMLPHLSDDDITVLLAAVEHQQDVRATVTDKELATV